MKNDHTDTVGTMLRLNLFISMSFLGSFLAFSPSPQAQIICSELIALKKHQAEKLSRTVSESLLRATEPDQNSTTAARTEEKYTLSKDTFARLQQEFKQNIESALPAYQLTHRDAQKPGFKNITWTAYSNRFKLLLNDGRRITGKIRVRKYGFIADTETVTKNNFRPLESLKDISFFEFKIQNPDFENSVLKPRIQIYDQDANLLLDPHLTVEQRQAIKSRTLDLNIKKTPEQQVISDLTVEYMLLAIQSLHSHSNKFTPEFETLYERTSYVIPLIDPQTQARHEIQITIDENITTSSLLYNKDSKAYVTIDPIVVAEVKIPIPLQKDFKDNDAAQASEIPGVAEVNTFLEKMRFHALKGFTSMKGKLFHNRQDLEPSKK